MRLTLVQSNSAILIGSLDSWAMAGNPIAADMAIAPAAFKNERAIIMKLPFFPELPRRRDGAGFC